jgi:hypothetical protein
MSPGYKQRSWRGLVPLCASALALSCTERLEFPAAWNLVSAAGAPLPYTVEADSACITQVMGASMKILDGKNYSSTYEVQQVCGGARVERLPDPGTRGAYRIRGDSIHFYDSNRFRVGTAHIRQDTMTIRGPEHSLIFVRVLP